MSSIATEQVWIETSAELNNLCDQWQQQAAIAIDTEFMRTSTFYPIAALFQVSDGRACYLIDPLKIDDFSGFKALLTNTAVTKVFHACSEDLEVFQTFLGVLPTPVFDTQWAAACAGHNFSMGYARLVEALLNVEVPKGETRSDWLQRPLSAPQLRYAALDVAYLLVIYGMLLQELKDQDRVAWVQEDCAIQVAQASQPAAYSDAYKKVKSAWRLNSQELSVLKAVAEWREIEARERDVPRNRLIKDNALWSLARTRPERIGQLHRVEGMPPRTIKTDGEDLLTMVHQWAQGSEANWPERLPQPLPKHTIDMMKSIKKVAREIAETLSVPPEILLRKKDIEDLIRSHLAGSAQLPLRLRGWRYSVLGERLLAFVNQA